MGLVLRQRRDFDPAHAIELHCASIVPKQKLIVVSVGISKPTGIIRAGLGMSRLAVFDAHWRSRLPCWENPYGHTDDAQRIAVGSFDHSGLRFITACSSIRWDHF